MVLGASYNSSAVIVNGTSGWGGAWVGASFTAGSDMIAAAGYTSNNNEIQITIYTAGSQFIMDSVQFTYEVEKTA